MVQTDFITAGYGKDLRHELNTCLYDLQLSGYEIIDIKVCYNGNEDEPNLILIVYDDGTKLKRTDWDDDDDFDEVKINIT